MFQVLELGCVDNCYVLMTRVTDFHFSDDEVSTEESQVSYIHIVFTEISHLLFLTKYTGICLDHCNFTVHMRLRNYATDLVKSTN